MKTKRQSYTGFRPIFTGSPSIVTGGFNLNRTAQRFNAGDVIPAGSLAIRDEQTRLVKIVKTAEVLAVDTVDTKIVTLKTGEFYQPTLSVGDSVLKTVTGLFADAPTITKVEKTATKMVITLSAAISGLVAGDTLVEVVTKSVATDPVISGVISVDTTTLILEPGLDIAANDKVMQYPLTEGALIANATVVTSYDKVSGKMVLAAAITDLAAGDSIVKVFADELKAVTTQTLAEAALIGDANCITLTDTVVSEYETSIDVVADTMQYELYERRVLPIPASQRDATGAYLKANPHIKLTKSF